MAQNKLIFFENHEHGRVIAQAAGVIYNVAGDNCISIVRDGKLLGGAVYSGYTGASIGMHVAGFCDDWMCRDALWASFHYPFDQLGVKKIFGQVPATNSKALEFDRKIGFKIETIIKDVYLDGDLVLMSMTKDECRWLKIKPRGLQIGKEII